MLKLKKFLASRSKSSSASQVRKSKKEGDKYITSEISVNEEYKEAFRTTSYLEIRTKAEEELGRTFCERLSSSSPPSSSSSSLSAAPNFLIHITDYLLEPRQETIHALMQNSGFHHLLVKFFDLSSEACYVCESILKCIQQTRANHRKIERVIKVSKRVFEAKSDDLSSGNVCNMIFQELSRFVVLENPLCIIKEDEFSRIHDSNVDLLARLKSKRRRIQRRLKFFRFCKKTGGYVLIVSHSAIIVALMVISLHGIMGVLAAPALIGLCSLGLLKKKIRRTDKLENLGSQIDIAAKGMFIMINDLDTLSRLAGRLSEEVEHEKTVAAMCGKGRKKEVLKEAVKELMRREARFIEQLQELEEHVYLCFNTINRSRRQVLEQIVGSQALTHSS